MMALGSGASIGMYSIIPTYLGYAHDRVHHFLVQSSLKHLSPKDVDLGGLIKASHWSPTDFTFRDGEESFSVTELSWPDHRAVLELWRYVGREESLPPPGIPNRSEFYVEPKVLTSPELLDDVLAECSSIAFEAGAKEIELPCPCDIKIDTGKLDVIEREFAFAWMRKHLADGE